MVPLSIVARVGLRLAFDGTTTQRSGPATSAVHPTFRTGSIRFGTASGYTSTFDNTEVLNLSQLNGTNREQGKVEAV